MVYGVTEGYEKKLVLSGIAGLKPKGKSLVYANYSNPVDFALPDGVTAAVDKASELPLPV